MNTNTTPALQATNIHQSFGHVDALRGVNLTLMPGEIVALLGVNGAGIHGTTHHHLFHFLHG